MSRLLPLLYSLLIGGAAGLAVLAVDLALAIWTLGFPIPLFRPELWAYLVGGALLGTILPVAWRAPDRGLAVALVLWGAGALERLGWMAWQRSGSESLTVLACLGGAMLLCATVWALGRLAGRLRFGVLLLVVPLAIALAINRNLVSGPLSAAALSIDAALAATALGAAVACRRARRIGPAVGVFAGLLFAVAGLRLWLPLPVSPEATPATGNLFLLVVDTLRADVLEDVLATTPEGQRFRERIAPAVQFEQMTAVAPWTAPSMGSLFTGLYPQEHGFGRSVGGKRGTLQPMPNDLPTLATTLQGAGFATGAFVTNPLLHSSTRFDRGFGHFESLAGASQKLPWLTALMRCGLLVDRYYQPADAVVRRGLRWLDRVPSSQRVFLWLHFLEPHRPRLAHPELPPDPAEEGLAEIDRLYRQETRAVLDQTARLLDELESRGRLQGSVVAFVSDHGEMLPRDGRTHAGGRELSSAVGHGHALYDELVRVPLWIRPPEPPAVAAVEIITDHTDLAPTLLELLGIDREAVGGGRGFSLVPWMEGRGSESPARSAALLSGLQIGSRQSGFRTPRAKVIEAGSGHLDLFDLVADPLEQHDLTQERPRDAKKSRKLLHALWAEIAERDDAADEDAPDLRRQLEALGYL